MVHGAGTRHAADVGQRVVGVGASALGAARLPAVLERLELERLLEQLATRVGPHAGRAHALEALERELGRNLAKVTRDQRSRSD